MKTLIIFILIFNTLTVFASVCPFQDGDFGEALTTEEFSFTDEVSSQIPENVLLENTDFFSTFDMSACTNGFVKSTFEQLSTGDKFYYFRSVEEFCDGGNTLGIILREGESKAIATISDGYVECL